MLCLKGNVVIDSGFRTTINGNALSTVDPVTYLGVTFTRIAKKLRRLSTPAEVIRKFAEACVIPITPYFNQPYSPSPIGTV